MSVVDGGLGRRYALISADAHAGASIEGYREYLPSRWHEAFDGWAASFTDGWADKGDERDENLRLGTSSFMSPVNWDGDRRVRDLEGEGIVAEVLFPNTVPPFYPSGCLTAPAPRSADEYEARWAGIQAHNRWLVDFCAELPGRRAGLAQIFLDDVEATVAEIRWAKEHGLRGVLLPGDHHDRVISHYYPRLDPIWAVCEELGMPVHRHAAVVADAEGPETGPASAAIGLYEASAFYPRVFSQLVLAGVFDRFPNLRFVFSETLLAWIPAMLERLDGFVRVGGIDGSIPNMLAGEALTSLGQRPSEYFQTNCYVGTFFGDVDMSLRESLGSDRLMWGADYPHHEGTFPFTREALRRNFAGLSEGEVRQLTSTTAADVYGFDLEFLQGIADEIGPLPDEIAVPLEVADFPDSPCPTFDARHAA